MDQKILTFSSAVPVPSGSDIIKVSGAVHVASDFAIRDTGGHNWLIPLRVRGYDKVAIGIFSSPAFNQILTITLQGCFDKDALITSGLLSVALPASTSARFSFASVGSGQGGTVGGANVANLAHYAVPGLGDAFPYIILSVSASVAPASGDFTLTVAR